MTGISEDRRPAASAHAVAVEDGKPVARRWLAKAKARASAARARLASLRARLGAGEQPWLLLAWDIASLKAAVHVGAAGTSRIVATAESKQARFADALDEVRTLLAGQSGVSPRRVALAARTLLPGVIDLPVAPDKPRPARQMRELLQSELEPILAEFGGLWSLGALLEARGHLSPVDRERVTLEEAVRREGLAPLARYLRELYETEEAADQLRLDQRDGALHVRVLACPAVTFMKSTGHTPSRWYRETTGTLYARLAKNAGLRFTLESYDEATGAAAFRFEKEETA